MGQPALTYATALIIQALAAGYRHGFDIMDATGLPSGTVYPALRRLERRGALCGEWESADRSRAEGRPSRRYYVLTGAGSEMVAVARARYPGLRHGIAGHGEGPQPVKA